MAAGGPVELRAARPAQLRRPMPGSVACHGRAGATPAPERGAASTGLLAARGVTPREAEVLAQVAAGRSNREIAGALHLSVRTVEKHVERLLIKTGHSRSELACFAAGPAAHPPASHPHPPTAPPPPPHHTH